MLASYYDLLPIISLQYKSVSIERVTILQSTPEIC